MLRAPSSRKRKKGVQKLNLIPILDAVFIFIFFLLMSANFIKIYEVSSDIPIISDREPPKNKKPLALTARIYQNDIKIYTGVPSRNINTITKTADGEYDYEALHNYLIGLKQRFRTERGIILEPQIDIEYDKLVKVMDAVRLLRRTDPEMYHKIKDKEGNETEERHYYLFDKIVFGNIQG